MRRALSSPMGTKGMRRQDNTVLFDLGAGRLVAKAKVNSQKQGKRRYYKHT